MSIWKRLSSQYSMDLINHPWASMLSNSLAEAEPETLAELKRKRVLKYYLVVAVGDAIKEVSELIEGGADQGSARQTAITNMLPDSDVYDPASGSMEGAEEDAIAGLNDFLKANFE